MEKKANKIAFKSEKQRQEQSMLNTKQQQGKKLWYLYILQTTIEKKSIPTYARIIPWFKILILEVLHEIHENETFFRFFNTKNGGKWELETSAFLQLPKLSAMQPLVVIKRGIEIQEHRFHGIPLLNVQT